MIHSSFVWTLGTFTKFHKLHHFFGVPFPEKPWMGDVNLVKLRWRHEGSQMDSDNQQVILRWNLWTLFSNLFWGIQRLSGNEYCIIIHLLGLVLMVYNAYVNINTSLSQMQNFATTRRKILRPRDKTKNSSCPWIKSEC